MFHSYAAPIHPTDRLQSRPRRVFLGLTFILLSLAAAGRAALAAPPDPIVPLQAKGDQFVAPNGLPVPLWGFNLIACYPTHEEAAPLAEVLASLQVNVVRPHHLMRPSSDWITRAPILALNQQGDTTRQPDKEAWDRFDYFNARLRDRGIYLMLPIQSSRRYVSGDVDVLTTDDADRAAWIAAMDELGSWDWKKAIDVRKMLAVIDERAAALDLEFARQLLNHVNPYTGQTYGRDPQVITVEAINESSSEYAIVCGNRFPSYWQNKLEGKWQAFAAAAGVESGDLYRPANAQMKNLRARFLRALDEAYFQQFRQVIRDTGCSAALTFSNLWRGENALQFHAQSADYIEDHYYVDPLVVRQADDVFARTARTQVAGKPYIVGELNQSEGADAIQREAPYRTMLPLAVAAYGSLQGWSGAVWFAWSHGDRPLGSNGWSTHEDRGPHLGDLISDGQLLDHWRTAGMIFRRRLITPSAQPITVHVDEPLTVGDYNGLMRGKYALKPGWQNVHGIRKTFGSDPQNHDSPWWMQSPEEPLVSDTGQITKDTKRRQLTVSAPQTEAFSGFLDDRPPARLQRLNLRGNGFATVLVVAVDHLEISASHSLLISRTQVGADGVETSGPSIGLTGIAQPPPGHVWRFHVTRPRDQAQSPDAILAPAADATLSLPAADWHEGELQLITQ